jgi:hypothetical protein
LTNPEARVILLSYRSIDTMKNPKDQHSFIKVYEQAFGVMGKFPVLWLPFAVFVCFEVAALIFLFYTPRLPLVRLFGPPITTFWGETYLHYPANFLLLPKLESLAKMGLNIVLGSLFTAVAVLMTVNIHQKSSPNLFKSFKKSLKSYLLICIVVLIVTLSYYFSVKLLMFAAAKYFIAGHKSLLFIGPRLWFGPIFTTLGFLMALFIQAAFIYALPVLLTEKRNPFSALIKSVILFKKMFIRTILLLGLPMLIYVPILALNYNSGLVINRIFPEFVLIALIIGILVSTLIIDPVVTVTTTILYLQNKEGSA